MQTALTFQSSPVQYGPQLHGQLIQTHAYRHVATLVQLTRHFARLLYCNFRPVVMSMQVLKRLPQLKKLDGIPVDVDERDQAKAAGGR